HLKNPKFKRIYCYFLAHKQTIFNLQVDSKSRIHANLKDISRMLKAKKPFLLNNTQLQPSLPKALSLFEDPPLDKWNSLLSRNFKKKRIVLQLIGTTKQIQSRNRFIAIIQTPTAEQLLACYNLHWPSRLNTLLTGLIFLLTTLESYTTVDITTNSTSLKALIEDLKNIPLADNPKIDKTQFPLIQRILYGYMLDRTIRISFDKDLKQGNPSLLTHLDITPHNFLYNRFTPLLLETPIPYQINQTLRETTTAINNLRWHNQQRISLWSRRFNNINWDMTLEYLSYNDAPKALYTHPSLSNLKNFKVKLLAEELPTHLILHFRNPKK